MNEESAVNAVNDAREVNVEPQTEPVSQSRKENSAFAAMRKREQYAVTQTKEMRAENESLKEQLKGFEAQGKELNELRSFKSRRLIEEDLRKVKEKYPSFCKDVDSLPEEYVRIMATGAVDALTAAEIIEAKKAKTLLNAPESIGRVENGVPEKEFYTPEEVDRISAADLRKNPGLMKKIQKSMTKWR